MLQRSNTQAPSSKDTFFLPDFFEGRTKAWGIFESRSGEVKRAFTANIHGFWKEREFVLEESFQFTDGVRDERIWTLSFSEDGTFTGTCSDVIKPASGYHDRNGCFLSYVIGLPVGKRLITVRFSDRFYLVDEDHLLNTAKVTKWGVRAGQLFIFFSRLG